MAENLKARILKTRPDVRWCPGEFRLAWRNQVPNNYLQIDDKTHREHALVLQYPDSGYSEAVSFGDAFLKARQKFHQLVCDTGCPMHEAKGQTLCSETAERK